TSPLPILRKDFIIDDYQLWESRAAGADAVLLIVAALSPMQLREYSEIAAELSLDVLVEVHTESEMFIALDMGADLVGINNRDLMTFRTDLCVTERLASMAPEGAQIVSESGIGEREDVVRVGQAGARAVLVGESLMRSEDIATKMQELMGFGEEV
ncbi:MAG: indole-3-glycerol phosphate synthase TrpC, partial [bacterium]